MPSAPLDPLIRLSHDAATVVALRVGQLPWWWLLQPARAQRETTRMFSEKQAALLETQLELAQYPWRFWLSLWQDPSALASPARLSALLRRGTARLLRPASRRVARNHARLKAS